MKEEEGRRNQALTLMEESNTALLYVKVPIFKKPQKRTLHPKPCGCPPAFGQVHGYLLRLHEKMLPPVSCPKTG